MQRQDGFIALGGIDSPVAGYMMAKRGVELIGVYFHSFPFTSDRAKEKVIDLAKIVSGYCGKVTLYVVPFYRNPDKKLLRCVLNVRQPLLSAGI